VFIIINLLITIIILGVIAYLVFWALGRIGLPEPFNKIALVILVLIVVIVLLRLLLPLLDAGSGKLLA
jgi:hypothetical protein